MRKFILLLSLLNIGNLILSHPGIGIVKDNKGNIYYTDLQQVWKIDKSGNKTIIVPNVHTHELYMDSANNLFGEHLWYNGERLNTWGHYVWCLKHDGSFVKIKGPSPGFLEDYSFVRDNEGNMYWAQHWKISRIFKKTIAGSVVTLAEGKFKDIRWMHVTATGTLYFIDLNDLYKIDKKGKLTLVAKSLEERSEGSTDRSLKHNIFGIWTDKTNNIYIAVLGGNVVKRITADGNVSTYLRTSGGWSPVSGLFDDGGNLWLMETNVLNEIKVRKISAKDLPGKSVQKKSFLKKSVNHSNSGGSRWHLVVRDR
jgi:hypothetical protein